MRAAVGAVMNKPVVELVVLILCIGIIGIS